MQVGAMGFNDVCYLFGEYLFFYDHGEYYNISSHLQVSLQQGFSCEGFHTAISMTRDFEDLSQGWISTDRQPSIAS
jgi:hypothetical protein